MLFSEIGNSILIYFEFINSIFMKEKKVSLLILIILLIATVCWFLIPNKDLENYGWVVYILPVPLGFFSVMVFSKLPFEKSLQIIITITLGAIIPLLLSSNFLFSLFIKQIFSVLLGSVVTFLLVKQFL